ncbi:MAG: hypothetical protein AAFY35_00235 [Pseudomonadota bacterium]
MSNAPFEPDPLMAEFAALKQRAEPPSDALLARVMADADAVQAQQAQSPLPEARGSALRRMIDVIGGWPSLAGMATAGIAGVWIGLTQPAALVQGSQVLLYGDANAALVDLDPGFGFSDLDGEL